MGVMKAEEPPMATAIRNGSGDAPITSATPTPMGAIKITAAALLITAERSIAVTRTIPSIVHAGTSATQARNHRSDARRALRSFSRGLSHWYHGPQQHDYRPIDSPICLMQREHTGDEKDGYRDRERNLDGQYVQGGQRHRAPKYDDGNQELSGLSDPEFALGKRK